MNKDAFGLEEISLTSASSLDLQTFTGTVLSLVTSATAILRSCLKYAARLKVTDLSMTSLLAECITVNVGLRQIEGTIHRDRGKLPEDRFEEYILQQYDNMLHACYPLFYILKTRLEKSGLAQMESMDKISFTAKLQSAWDRNQSNVLHQSISGLARAINILSTAFQSYVPRTLQRPINTLIISSRETSIKASELIRSTEATQILSQVSSDAISLRESLQRVSVTENERNTNLLSDKMFGFDEMLMTTTPYRKALAKGLPKPEELDIRNRIRQEDRPIHAIARKTNSKSPPPLSPIAGRRFREQRLILLKLVSDVKLPPEGARLTPASLKVYHQQLKAIDRHIRQMGAMTSNSSSLPPLSAISGRHPQEQGLMRLGPVSDLKLPPEDACLAPPPLSVHVGRLDRTHYLNPESRCLAVFRMDTSDTSAQLFADSMDSRPVPKHIGPPPTLLEVLSGTDLQPYSLADLYLYMLEKGIPGSVNYIHFW